MNHKSFILEEVSKIIKKINAEGHKVNKTREIINVALDVFPHKLNLDVEERLIKEHYNEHIEDYDKRLELEKDHYNFLKAFLIHKVKENIYFFKLKSDDFSSRKNVIWSNDCVSSIQFLHRKHVNTLIVMIRSSDTVRLLPIDILYMSKLLDEVLNRYNINKNPLDSVRFHVVSCHYYIRDLHIVNTILR